VAPLDAASSIMRIERATLTAVSPMRGSIWMLATTESGKTSCPCEGREIDMSSPEKEKALDARWRKSRAFIAGMWGSNLAA
jgi:hypothetical protein